MATDGLALTSDERDLQSALRAMLAGELSSAGLRAALETDAGYRPELWSALASDLGLAGLAVPEEFGGLGLGPAEAAVVLEDLGRVLYPGPFLATWLATTALLATGDAAAHQRWLPRIAEGTIAGCVAVADKAGSWGQAADAVRARHDERGWRLDGARWFVIAGHVADVILVPAVTDSGLSVFLVERGADGFSAEPVSVLDLTRKVAVVSLDGAPATLLGREGGGQAAVEAAEHALLLACAAEAAGGIGWCLDACVDYAKTRTQFGRPIGGFQAVAHACVDMLAHHQSSSAAARYAAVATARGAPDALLAARVAALRTGEAYRTVTEAAIHLLGGIGFTWEHDAHLYYRRAWSSQQLTATPQAHRAAIAELVRL
jgi:alkylation response protein AidB-like acyl-CoA dehydrogenase